MTTPNPIKTERTFGDAETSAAIRAAREADPRIAAILQCVPEGAEVLDLGCVQHDAAAEQNDDWLHGHLRDHAHEVVGLDTLGPAVRELRERGYHVIEADAEDFALGREFDVIVAGELIEHLSRPGDMLECAHEHLRPDGRVVLTTPNVWRAIRLRRIILSPADYQPNPEHTSWYCPRVLRELFRRHGFSAYRVRGVRPPTLGLTDLCWRLGHEMLGATHWLATGRRP